MTITLSKTTDENNVVYKTLSNQQIFSDCVLKENTSVITPTIFIQSDLNLSTYNYCYIPEFNRYYYIINISSVRNGLWQINLKVDVLMTYKNNFNNFDMIIKRIEKDGVNKYINDNENVVLSKQRVFCKKFPETPFSKNMSIILTTVGVGEENE